MYNIMDPNTNHDEQKTQEQQTLEQFVPHELLVNERQPNQELDDALSSYYELSSHSTSSGQFTGVGIGAGDFADISSGIGSDISAGASSDIIYGIGAGIGQFTGVGIGAGDFAGASNISGTNIQSNDNANQTKGSINSSDCSDLDSELIASLYSITDDYSSSSVIVAGGASGGASGDASGGASGGASGAGIYSSAGASGAGVSSKQYQLSSAGIGSGIGINSNLLETISSICINYLKNPDPIERARKPRGSLLFWSLNDEERRKKNVIDTDYDKILTIIDRLNQNAKNIIGTVQTKKFIINISILVIFELNKIRKNIETLQRTNILTNESIVYQLRELITNIEKIVIELKIEYNSIEYAQISSIIDEINKLWYYFISERIGASYGRSN